MNTIKTTRFVHAKRIPLASALFTMCLFLAFAVGSVRADNTNLVTITILHTADLHGHLSPLPEYNEMYNTGGLLKCASVIKKIRENTENIILVDCGDLFQGAAESSMNHGRLMARAVKLLRYDCLVTGNHEFDWGLECLEELYNIVQTPVLAADIRALKPEISSEFIPFLIKDIQGVKVALIGISNPNIPNWSLPELIESTKFDDSVETLKRVIPEVRERGADIIVALVHQGYIAYGDNMANRINAIARRFPDIDVIMGAHIHRPVEMEMVNNVLYTQAGPYGTSLGETRLVYDKTKGKLIKRIALLIPVDGKIVPDPELEKLFGNELSEIQKSLSMECGSTLRDIKPDDVTPGQSPVQTLISAAIAESVNADVVIHGTLTKASIGEGKIYARQIWGLVPFDNRIGVAMLDEQDLKAVLEENTKFMNSWRFKGVYGLSYTLKPDGADGWTVSNIILDNNRRLSDGERIRVAFNSYDLASAGGRLPVLRATCTAKAASFVLLPEETRDAVFQYVKKHSPLDIQTKPGAVINDAK